jgi:hypothetical protein
MWVRPRARGVVTRQAGSGAGSDPPAGNPAADAAALAPRIGAHIERLAGEIGERNVFRPDALAAARDYIEACFAEAGYAVRRQTYDVNGLPCSNLEATLPAAGDPHGAAHGAAGDADAAGGAGGTGDAPAGGPMLLLGAHYDSVRGSPGANDNGSGVAALIEVARILAAAPERPRLAVRFVAFVNEEPPFFWTRRQGSVVYARAARRRGDDIRLMIALETMGCYFDTPGSQRYPPLFRHFYPDRGNFLAVLSDLRWLRQARRVARALRRASDLPIEHAGLPRFFPGVAWSDHWSFWKQRYPAVMLTDTAFHRYAQYHTARDTPDKVNVAELARATAAVCAATPALAADADTDADTDADASADTNVDARADAGGEGGGGAH